jgi:hypothetical protein
MTGASSGVFGASSGSLLLRKRRHLHFVRVCVLIFYVLFREPQLLDASSDRGDSGGVAKLSKSRTKDDRGIFGGIRGILGGPCYSEPGDIYISSTCVLIFYVLFREPQLLDASSDRGDSGGAAKLSKSRTKDDRGIFGGIRGIFGGPCYSEPGDIYISSTCVLIFYVLFCEPQLLDASSDRGDSGAAGKLSKS